MMTDVSKILANPPIVEAVIEFLFDKNLDANSNNIIKKYFEQKCEKQEPISDFEIIVENDGQGASGVPKLKKTSESVCRYYFSSGTRVVVVKPSGITFSHLKPYTSFDKFSSYVHSEIKNIELDKITKVQRLGVRYINVFVAPVSSEYTNEYLVNVPNGSDLLPESPVDFISRVTIPIKDLGSSCILTLAASPIFGKANNTQVTVDIDMFKVYTAAIDCNNMWKELKELKTKLNSIFFRSITKKALDLFL